MPYLFGLLGGSASGTPSDRSEGLAGVRGRGPAPGEQQALYLQRGGLTAERPHRLPYHVQRHPCSGRVRAARPMAHKVVLRSRYRLEDMLSVRLRLQPPTAPNCEKFKLFFVFVTTLTSTVTHVNIVTGYLCIQKRKKVEIGRGYLGIR